VYHATDKRVTTLDARGFFIGHSALVDIAEYREETVGFETNDKILCYTDGLTEGCNSANELYGKDRLFKAVARYGDRSPRELLDTLLDDQTTFRDKVPLRDDFTMLCIQIGDSEKLLKESGFTKKDAPNILGIRTIPEIEKMCAIILRTMDYYGFTDLEIKRTKVCIFEMAINAVIHGNGSDPRKKALVLYKVAQSKVIISIVDEGDGYDYLHVPDPLLEENLLKDHGRGIHFIKTYMDEVHYNKKGNRIMVIKYHDGKKV
jgi:serine/threonine-protein kinase RsbW